MAYWFLAAGVLLLLVGSEAAVRGGVGLTRTFGMPPLLIGILVIASITSAPELFVSLRAATAGAPDIALGDIVGGSIINILPILGLGALIRPMVSPPKVVMRDGGAMLAGSLAVVFLALGGAVTRQSGLLLLAGLAVYVALTFFTDWRRTPDHSVALANALGLMQGEPPHTIAGLFLLLFGLIVLALGAHFTVSGSVVIARDLHLQDAFVGLTVVALGTSLPKLIFTIVAAVRGRTDIAVGHLICANVFNLFGVLGITATIMPLAVSPLFGSADAYVLAAASAAVLPLLAMRWRLSRPRGVLLVVAYGCYLAFIAWRQGLLHL